MSTALGTLTVGIHADLLPRASHVLIRPEAVQFLDGQSGGVNRIEGTVTDVLFSGRTVEYDIETAAGARFAVHAPPTSMRSVGDTVHLYLPPERCVLLLEEAPQ